MKTYKLYQLLKMRKKFITELNDLKKKFQYNNSTIKGAIKNYDAPVLLGEIEALKAKLVILKKLIQVNTLPVYEKIFMIEEHKDMIATLRATSTNDGLVEGRGYGDNPPQEYEATIKHVEMDKKIKSIEVEIDELQGEIDEHNYTTEVEIPF